MLLELPCVVPLFQGLVAPAGLCRDFRVWPVSSSRIHGLAHKRGLLNSLHVFGCCVLQPPSSCRWWPWLGTFARAVTAFSQDSASTELSLVRTLIADDRKGISTLHNRWGMSESRVICTLAELYTGILLIWLRQGVIATATTSFLKQQRRLCAPRIVETSQFQSGISATWIRWDSDICCCLP